MSSSASASDARTGNHVPLFCADLKESAFMATIMKETTTAWPQTLDFIGLNKPVGKEWSEKGLKVEGTIPADVRGAFFRAVPDPAFAPFVENDTVLSGDGMISKMLFNEDGTVDYDIRFVHTRPLRRAGEGGQGAVRQVSQSLHRRSLGKGDRPHARQHHPSLARWHAADDQGGWPRLPRQPGHAGNDRLIRFRRRAQIRDDDRARPHRSGDARDVLLRL